MDADGLPLVGPGIDYRKVDALHQKRTLAFLNHFITHTARFLNKFSCVCEEKLEMLSTKIQRLEIAMNILETKLSSIPGLENVTASTNTSTTNPSASVNSSPPTSSSQQTAATQASDPPSEQPPKQEEKPKVTVSQDPRYAKYFKMLTVGVPQMAVKQKMQAEGLDPDMLNTPDAAAPAELEENHDDNGDSDSTASFSD